MEIIQEIGAYAGLGAVLGLAVLSALYFSQARDVKRLREWAGRAPERVDEPATAGRVVAQPKQPAPKPAEAPSKPATPAIKPGQPVPKPGSPKPAPTQAAAAGAGAAAAAAGPAAATPAGQKQGVAAPAAASAEVATEDGAPSKEDESGAGAPAPATPAAARASGAPAEASTVKEEGAAAGEAAAPVKEPPERKPAVQPAPAAADGETPRPPSRPGGAPPPVPPPARSRPAPRPAGSRPTPSPSQTSVLPPRTAPARPWYRSPRYVLLALAGVLIVGGGAAFGISELTKEEGATPSQTADENGGNGGAEEPRRRRRAVVPSRVTVSVLNGTTVPGLAAQIGDKVEAAGFQLGNVTNSSDQQRAESVVQYAPGAEREAAAVGRKLGIAQREAADAQTQALGGDATVVVITGADQTQ